MFLLDIRIRFIILSVVIFLSFLHYLYDPLKHSDEPVCIGLPCRNYSLIMNLLSFTFLSAMIISMGILDKSPFLPTYWFVIIILMGYMVIFIDWRNSKIVKPRKGRITPPPIGYIPKDRRIVVVSSLLVVYILLFCLNYMAHKVPIQSDNISEMIFWNIFGSFKERRGAFMAGWLSILGVVTAIINIIFTDSFHPGKYNLPNSWRV
jgi:hypothetical protein